MRVINLREPIGSERVRGFQPPWYTVWIYKCGHCEQEVRIKQNWSGPAPLGAIACHCDNK
jgi:hypothetical protein